MSAALKLRCPKCGRETESYRRPPHAPCTACAIDGRGVVRLELANPPEPPRSEPPEPKRPAVLGEMSTATVAWDCDRNGHVFSGGSCGHCGMKAPEDPASAPEIRALEAAHKAARTLVALLVLACTYACVCREAHAEEWRKPNGPEIAVESAALVVTALDVLQTLDLKHHPGLYETNALLGPSPSDKRLLLLGGASIVAQAAIWYALPPPWRQIFSLAALTVETYVVTSNAMVGLAVRL